MKALVLDTNLLVLLVVGTLGEQTIARHKRTRTYDAVAFRLLEGYVRQARHLVTTPHILTETSNLVRQCGEPLRGALSEVFAAFVGRAEETAETARLIVARPEHECLGLADAALIALQTSDVVVLTDDNALYLASRSAGYDAINFSHVRESAG